MANVAGAHVILNAGNAERVRARVWQNKVKHEGTPVFPVDAIPHGRAAHIGEGLWFHRCAAQGCSAYALTYGSLSYVYELARHEAEDHGLQVVGYNVAMLGGGA